MSIRRRIEKQRYKIRKASLRIEKIQAECTHPNVVRVAKANTGNWCEQDDCYWYEFKCPDCNKFWQEDQ